MGRGVKHTNLCLNVKSTAQGQVGSLPNSQYLGDMCTVCEDYPDYNTIFYGVHGMWCDVSRMWCDVSRMWCDVSRGVMYHVV